jgi:hypothetical protein
VRKKTVGTGRRPSRRCCCSELAAERHNLKRYSCNIEIA